MPSRSLDTFLLWRLTEGAVHANDATNASRTALYDIHANAWSAELCAQFGVPGVLLPEVRDCAAHYGTTALFGGAIPIRRSIVAFAATWTPKRGHARSPHGKDAVRGTLSGRRTML
jgi:glycerol kinase